VNSMFLSMNRIESDVQALTSELLTTRKVPLAEEYSGSVLFMEEAAGELFSQGFSDLLAAKRIPLSDDAQANTTLARTAGNPFSEKIGLKVASNFISMDAIPTLKNYGHKPLLGSYRMDEEGILWSDVSLIENGLLKNLLASRTPTNPVVGCVETCDIRQNL